MSHILSRMGGGASRVLSAMMKPTLLSLPTELLNYIGACLEDENLCRMELASKDLRNILSKPTPNGIDEWCLDLKTYCGPKLRSPEAWGWHHKRIARYRYIDAHFSDKLSGTIFISRGGVVSPVVFPQLPVLLAACAPSTELSLIVEADQGDRFLALSSNTPLGASPELSSFWPNLKQHLTKLQLRLYPGRGEALRLRLLGVVEALHMLTALQEVEIGRGTPPSELHCQSQHCNMSGEKVILNLPHLFSLRLTFLEQGEVVSLCPKLTEACFICTDCMRITLEGAPLTSLKLIECNELRFNLKSLATQLGNLNTLAIRDGREVGKLLIEDVGQMKHLHTLVYEGFPKACMPRSFPPGLQYIELTPKGWCLDLPEGLKELQQLTYIYFDTEHPRWDIVRPLADLLPLAGIKGVRLGNHRYKREGEGPLKYDPRPYSRRAFPKIMSQTYYDDLAP